MAGQDYTVYRDDLAFSQDDAQNGKIILLITSDIKLQKYSICFFRKDDLYLIT